MIFNLDNPYEKEKFKTYCNDIFLKGGVIDIKRKNKNRTLKQNNYLHLILSFFACEYGCSVEEVKVDLFKRKCNREIFEDKKVNKKGLEITYLRSTSELDTSEMTVAIDRFRAWSSAEAGIYLPSPNEHDFLIHVQQEIERNKEFI